LRESVSVFDFMTAAEISAVVNPNVLTAMFNPGFKKMSGSLMP
jgi:hypothetical protein